MAIRVNCECGHEAEADDALANRWIRCAGCDRLLQVRRVRAIGQPGRARAPRPAPPPIPIPDPPAANLPLTAWRRSISAHRGRILLLAINLAILTGAGLYANRADSRIRNHELLPDRPELIKPIPQPGIPRPIDVPAGKPAGEVPFSTREIVAKCEASVAQIRGRFGSGSGFLVAPGLLATNAHVVAGEIPGDLRIHFPSRGDAQQGPHRATLVDEDIPRDLALLKVDVPFPPLPMASPYRFRRGEDVTIIGSPGVGSGILTLENAVSRGVLSTETIIHGQKYYQLGASVNPGNSGGPVFDSKGEVVGVVTLKARDEESIGFCIPVDDLARAIDRAKAITPEEIRVLTGRHGASAVFSSVIDRASLCAAVLEAQCKRIEGILVHHEDAGDLVETLKKSRDRLVLSNAVFDDGYRVAVSEILSDPGLPQNLRNDLRDLWSTCNDMSRLALDSRPNLGRFHAETASLLIRASDLKQRLKHALGIDDP